MKNSSNSSKEKLLLHICCAPDLTVPLIDLREEYEIYGFFPEVNIYPQEEFDKRLDEVKKYCERFALSWEATEYNRKKWSQLVQGLENEPEKGPRCKICIKYRLEKSFKYAQDKDIKKITTTLTTSSHKDITMINGIGNELAEKYKVEYLPFDFKKNDGFLRSINYCKEYGIYRQNYCGCEYSTSP